MYYGSTDSFFLIWHLVVYMYTDSDDVAHGLISWGIHTHIYTYIEHMYVCVCVYIYIYIYIYIYGLISWGRNKTGQTKGHVCAMRMSCVNISAEPKCTQICLPKVLTDFELMEETVLSGHFWIEAPPWQYLQMHLCQVLVPHHFSRMHACKYHVRSTNWVLTSQKYMEGMRIHRRHGILLCTHTEIAVCCPQELQSWQGMLPRVGGPDVCMYVCLRE